MKTLEMLLEYIKRDKIGIYGVIIILGIIIYGILGSVFIMKLDIYDSFYYTIITIATVGFGDITPTTPLQKIFSATLALAGVGLLAYILTIIISSVTENLQDIRSGRHMEKRLAEMENHYVLCGFGRVGLSVFEELKKRNQKVTRMKRQQKTLKRMKMWLSTMQMPQRIRPLGNSILINPLE